MRFRQIRDALLKTPVGLLGLLSLSAQLVVSFWVVTSSNNRQATWPELRPAVKPGRKAA